MVSCHQFLQLPFPCHLSSSPTLIFLQNTRHVPFQTSLRIPSTQKSLLHTFPRVSFALTESDSPKSIEPDAQSLLRRLAKCFDLPQDYLSQLPRDLRLDLNDAAFDLSNGPVLDECGEEVGDTLLNLSRAWELAETSTSYTLVRKLPELEVYLTENAKLALGKRLVAAGRRFQSMGQFGQGELQKIAKTMIETGRLLSASSTGSMPDDQPKKESRMFKFGELQVEVTPDKANIGALISFIFGILSWEVAQGIQSIPENSLQYANDNALLLAKSLRGALLVIFYGSTTLSAFTTVGLILLGLQLKSKEKLCLIETMQFDLMRDQWDAETNMGHELQKGRKRSLDLYPCGRTSQNHLKGLAR